MGNWLITVLINQHSWFRWLGYSYWYIPQSKSAGIPGSKKLATNGSLMVSNLREDALSLHTLDFFGKSGNREQPTGNRDNN